MGTKGTKGTKARRGRQGRRGRKGRKGIQAASAATAAASAIVSYKEKITVIFFPICLDFYIFLFPPVLPIWFGLSILVLRVSVMAFFFLLLFNLVPV